jgi:hypothetical protein
MGRKQRTRGKVFRHPLFLRLLQAFCIFESVPMEAASPTKPAESSNWDASSRRKKNGLEATTKLDIGGVI